MHSPHRSAGPEFTPAERSALADTALMLGPDAATIDEGWAVRDLVAHVVLRERRPDAAAGVVLPPLSRWTRSVQSTLAAQPFERLVEQLRAGPPAWSPMRLPRLREPMNLIEFFVHHEDIRRAQRGWEPRVLPTGMTEAMWRFLSPVVRLRLRRLPVALTFVPPTGTSLTVGRKPEGKPTVVLHGEVGELVMWAFDRKRVARVDVQGAPEDVRLVSG